MNNYQNRVPNHPIINLPIVLKGNWRFIKSVSSTYSFTTPRRTNKHNKMILAGLFGIRHRIDSTLSVTEIGTDFGFVAQVFKKKVKELVVFINKH